MSMRSRTPQRSPGKGAQGKEGGGAEKRPREKEGEGEEEEGVGPLFFGGAALRKGETVGARLLEERLRFYGVTDFPRDRQARLALVAALEEDRRLAQRAGAASSGVRGDKSAGRGVPDVNVLCLVSAARSLDCSRIPLSQPADEEDGEAVVRELVRCGLSEALVRSVPVFASAAALRVIHERVQALHEDEDGEEEAGGGVGVSWAVEESEEGVGSGGSSPHRTKSGANGNGSAHRTPSSPRRVRNDQAAIVASQVVGAERSRAARRFRLGVPIENDLAASMAVGAVSMGLLPFLMHLGRWASSSSRTTLWDRAESQPEIVALIGMIMLGMALGLILHRAGFARFFPWY